MIMVPSSVFEKNTVSMGDLPRYNILPQFFDVRHAYRTGAHIPTCNYKRILALFSMIFFIFVFIYCCM